MYSLVSFSDKPSNARFADSPSSTAGDMTSEDTEVGSLTVLVLVSHYITLNQVPTDGTNSKLNCFGKFVCSWSTTTLVPISGHHS